MQFCQGFLSGAPDLALLTLMTEGRPVSGSVVAEGAVGAFSPAAATPIVLAATEAAKLVLRKSRRLNSFWWLGWIISFRPLCLLTNKSLRPQMAFPPPRDGTLPPGMHSFAPGGNGVFPHSANGETESDSPRAGPSDFAQKYKGLWKGGGNRTQPGPEPGWRRIGRVKDGTGRIVSVADRILSAVEEGEDGALTSVLDWQKEEVEMARAIVNHSGDRFIDPPGKFEFNEYRHMERFIGALR